MSGGALDAQGIWQYGEDDPASPFSNLLNLLAESTSTELANDRARLSALEAEGSKASWSPSLTNVTVGNGSMQGRYARVGDMVMFQMFFVLGSTSAIGNNFQCAAPVQPVFGANSAIGSGFIGRGTSNTGRNLIVARMVTSTDFILYFNGGVVNATAPFATTTWQSGDIVSLAGSYISA